MMNIVSPTYLWYHSSLETFVSYTRFLDPEGIIWYSRVAAVRWSCIIRELNPAQDGQDSRQIRLSRKLHEQPSASRSAYTSNSFFTKKILYIPGARWHQDFSLHSYYNIFSSFLYLKTADTDINFPTARRLHNCIFL